MSKLFEIAEELFSKWQSHETALSLATARFLAVSPENVLGRLEKVPKAKVQSSCHCARNTQQPCPQGHNQEAQSCPGSCSILGKLLFTEM